MSKLGLIAAAIVLMFSGSAHAAPVTYKLVADPGRFNGWQAVGTITFADGFVGSDSYDIATAGTEFDLELAGSGSPLMSWKSGDADIYAVGTVHFQSGVIGDAVLIPDQNGTGIAFPSGQFSFRYDVDLADFPYPDTFLDLNADDFFSGWGSQDLVKGAAGEFLGDFSAFDNLSSHVEWELRVIPEPGTAVLSGLAIVAVLVRRRRKRNAR